MAPWKSETFLFLGLHLLSCLNWFGHGHVGLIPFGCSASSRLTCHTSGVVVHGCLCVHRKHRVGCLIVKSSCCWRHSCHYWHARRQFWVSGCCKSFYALSLEKWFQGKTWANLLAISFPHFFAVLWILLFMWKAWFSWVPKEFSVLQSRSNLLCFYSSGLIFCCYLKNQNSKSVPFWKPGFGFKLKVLKNCICTFLSWFLCEVVRPLWLWKGNPQSVSIYC